MHPARPCTPADLANFPEHKCDVHSCSSGCCPAQAASGCCTESSGRHEKRTTGRSFGSKPKETSGCAAGGVLPTAAGKAPQHGVPGAP
eukprot:2760392-Lingulodinium_polyedra.AAC.1